MSQKMAKFSVRCRAKDAEKVATLLRERRAEVQACYAERMKKAASVNSMELTIGEVVQRPRSVVIEVNAGCAINSASLAVEAVVSPHYEISVPLWG